MDGQRSLSQSQEDQFSQLANRLNLDGQTRIQAALLFRTFCGGRLSSLAR